MARKRKRSDLWVSLDTETAGLGGIMHRIGLLSSEDDKLWFSLEEALKPVNRKKIDALLEEASIVVGHNLKYDAHIVRRDLALELPWDKVQDTLVEASFIVTGRGEKSLLACSLRNLPYNGEEDLAIEDYRLAKRIGHDFTKIPDELLRPYTFKQLENCLCLHAYWRQYIEDCPSYEQERQLVRILFEMEWRGLPIDVDVLVKARTKILDEISSCREQLREDLGQGPKFNPGSQQQIGPLLVEDLGLSLPPTPSGLIQLREEDLAPYKNHPDPRVARVVTNRLEYKKAEKLHGTYIAGMMSRMDANHCLHTSFSNTVTRTGRLSSSDPNLQNVTGKDASSSAAFVRKAFPPRPGFTVVGIDYRQIEFRLAVFLSNDEKGIEEFERGWDPHKATATLISGVPYDKVTDAERGPAKTINFGVIYGMGAPTLAKSIGVSVQEAYEFLNTYFRHYRGVRRHINLVLKAAKKFGIVTLPSSGRILHLEKREYYKGFNYLVQGEAAEVIKRAMIAVDRLLVGRTSNLLLQIHDELVLELWDSEREELLPLITEQMIAASPFPMDVEVKQWGTDWSNLLDVTF